VPTAASLLAVVTNLVLNYILIFGKLGFPALGAKGAAIATVISRFAELAVVALWTHINSSLCPWAKGLYKNFVIGSDLFRRIMEKGLPLIANEFFWALGMTVRNQCFSTRGLEAVAAFNIASTVINLFSVAYMSVGHSITVIIGALLGAGEKEKARSDARRCIAFSVTSGAVMGLVMIAFSGLFPNLYNTTDSVRTLAGYMMIVTGIALPFCAFSHSAYFTLRSGGKVLVTLVLDSGFIWAIVVPTAFVLSRFTGADIRTIFAVCTFTEVLKFVFGLTLLKKVNWTKKIV
ncbi:MAG: MATE family efflux transporter, partial [Clostridia bacterium]|nr:MATE family efflux transporter [Clostridia bacterium]